MTGEAIPARDFNNSEGGLELFGTHVFFDWKTDKATAQFDFDRELWHRKVNPIEVPMSPEEEHLLRVDSRENGISRMI